MDAKLSLRELLNGAEIVTMVAGKYTLRTPAGNPIVRMTYAQAKPLLDVCKKIKKRGFVYYTIERRLLQRLHGNDWRYKYYRKFIAPPDPVPCTTSTYQIISSPYKSKKWTTSKKK